MAVVVVVVVVVGGAVLLARSGEELGQIGLVKVDLGKHLVSMGVPCPNESFPRIILFGCCCVALHPLPPLRVHRSTVGGCTTGAEPQAVDP